MWQDLGVPNSLDEPVVGVRGRLTRSQQDYLKAIYNLGGVTGLVNTSHLAERLGVAAPSATEMLAKLSALGLVSHDRYHGVILTEDGRAAGAEMIRHHRLIEMFLVNMLGYTWDEVHEEAERLEHVISERMEQRIYLALGRPKVDCHGDPIPTLAGEVPSTHYRSLMEARTGEHLHVRRVSDRDAGKLRALKRLGVDIGTELEVLAESEYEGPIEVRLGGRRRDVPIGVARAVFVE